ncbi:MAG: helix-turn-helix domain-containing protein [archaeon]
MSELTALLKRIGLNEYESRVYSVLNSASSMTASDISRKGAIPRARVYDVLLSLEKKGFVMVSVGRPVSFKPVEPEKALMNFEKQKRQLFENELKEMNSLKEILKKNFSQKNPSEEDFSGAWSISGNQINHIIESSLKNAKESVVISTSEANALKKIEAFDSKFRALKARDVKLKFLLSSVSGKIGKELSDFTAIKSKSNLRFMVFDEKKVLLFLNERKEENERALLLENPFIAKYLSQL